MREEWRKGCFLERHLKDTFISYCEGIGHLQMSQDNHIEVALSADNFPGA